MLEEEGGVIHDYFKMGIDQMSMRRHRPISFPLNKGLLLRSQAKGTSTPTTILYG